MPVDFLTKEQAKRYGRYADEPSYIQLSRYFHLDDTDKALIRKKRGDHNKLGFAIQLCTVRFLGTFLSNPIDVPQKVVSYLSNQLGIKDTSCLQRYMARPATHREHAGEIQKLYGYNDFTEQPGHFRLTRWLYTRAWISAERPSMLFDLATARLVEHKILLPGVSILSRMVARIRERATIRLWHKLSVLPGTEQKEKLRNLLVVADDTHKTPLDRLRRSPTIVSGPSLVNALNRIKEIYSIGINSLDMGHIPIGRMKELARYASAAKAQSISRMPEERKIATLLAFARSMEISATDDALDLLDLLITDIIGKAKRTGQAERLRTIHDLDAAAIQLYEACKIVLNETLDDKEIRSIIFAHISKDQLTKATAVIEELTRPPDDNYYKELTNSYLRVRRFLPTLLHTIAFKTIQAGQITLDAINFLFSIEGKRKPNMDEAPLKIVSKAWKRLVIKKDKEIDRRAYTLCTLERLQDSLRRRDIFVDSSDRWCDTRSKLLQGEEWLAVRSKICSTLGRQKNPKYEIVKLRQQLDMAYKRTAANLPHNDAVRIEQENGEDKLVLSGLDKLEEPQSLIELRKKVSELIPSVDIPELLLEINARTGFANEFTHISENEARVEDLPISVCAVLLSESCNIGLEPLINNNVPALKRNRLSWVQQNYIRYDTITRANVTLVDSQAQIPLVQMWGGGEVASADGLRFVTPVRTINAGFNKKFFGPSRGITYYNFTSDQFTGFHGIVIPGTLRDSMYILEGLLEQETSLEPLEIMADTAGVSDIVFGLFWLLGYQFSPRLADIGGTRFWRIDSTDYGLLNNLAKHKIDINLTERNWDDMLRIAGSLKLGTVKASELIRSLLKSDRPSTLAKSIGNLGRIPKTLYLLSYIDDENYRRRVLNQLNRGEGRHTLARAIFHGHRGEIRKRYREGQEDQLSALGLVVNAVVLWNTIYMEAALNHLRKEGYEVRPEDVSRLSPLGHENLNLLGRYNFSLTEPVSNGQLRPLRDTNDYEE